MAVKEVDCFKNMKRRHKVMVASPRWNLGAVGARGRGQGLLGTLAFQLHVLIRVLIGRVCQRTNKMRNIVLML